MRILLVTGNYPPTPCGIGDYTQRLAVEMSRRRHDVFILTSAPTDSTGPAADGRGPVEILRAVSKWDSQDCRKILEIVRSRRIDLLHIQYQPDTFRNRPMISLLPWALKRQRPKKVRVVVTLHELAGPATPFLPGPARRGWLLPLTFFADAIIVTNERDLFYLGQCPWLTRRLHLIPLAAAIDARSAWRVSREAVREKMGVHPDETLLIRFGFIHNARVSLIPQLLDAVQRLLREGRRVKLVFLGGADPRGTSEALAMADRLGIKEGILFTGYRPAEEVSQILASADIGIQLYPEGICEKRSGLQTAMAHGLPVIGLGKGRIPSMFEHGRNLWLLSAAHPRSVAEGIKTLMNDAGLRDLLGRNAVQTAARFNWQAIGQTTDTLYQSLSKTGTP